MYTLYTNWSYNHCTPICLTNFCSEIEKATMVFVRNRVFQRFRVEVSRASAGFCMVGPDGPRVKLYMVSYGACKSSCMLTYSTWFRGNQACHTNRATTISGSRSLRLLAASEPRGYRTAVWQKTCDARLALPWTSLNHVGLRPASVPLAWPELSRLQRPCDSGSSTSGGMGKAL